MRARRERFLSLALVFPLLLKAPHVTASHDPSTELEQLFYDRWVVAYCSLGGADVALGFELALKDLKSRRSPDEQTVEGAESRSLSMVEREWSNRGLGGYKVWCRTEGVAAAARFRRFVE